MHQLPLFNKAYEYTAANEARRLGLYPYFRMIESEQDTKVVMNGKEVIMLGSNSYLGLTNHPDIKAAAQEAIARYGTGCAGSRFLNGTLDIHIQLEEKLAEFVHKDSALLYSTGFQVNQGVIATIVGRKDYVLYDKSDHASIIEGIRLAFGKGIKFKHNDPQDLEERIKQLPEDAGKLIVVDGVFSMEGDVAPLPEIVHIAKKYKAAIMVDDAHGLGVMGPNGEGTAAHFGLTDDVDLIMGTFSKSLASIGGFIAGKREVIDYLKHHSRALIFSASMPPASVASVLCALDILQRDNERREKLWANTQRMKSGLEQVGFRVGPTETPIIPVLIGDDAKVFQACIMLQEEGVFVNPVISPAVEPENSLFRISLMATHSFEEIDIALEKMERVGRMLKIIE